MDSQASKSEILKLNWVAFCALVKKESYRVIRIWRQTVLPPIISTCLYFLIFGNLIGNRIGSMSGVSYIDFIFPGLVLMTVINNSYANVSSSFFGMKFQKSIEELFVAPVHPITIILGFLSGGIIRSLGVGLIVILVSTFFIDIKIHSLATILFTLFASSLIFSLGGLINGVYARNFDDVSIIPTFVLTPLIYLGGVFYSIELLPDYWQSISQFNPILYLISTMRYGFLGVSDVNTNIAFLMAIIFIIVLSVLCYFLIIKGLGNRLSR